MRCNNWHVDPLSVEDVRSNFFENESLFPKGSIGFDCGLVMRNIPHVWEIAADMYV